MCGLLQICVLQAVPIVFTLAGIMGIGGLTAEQEACNGTYVEEQGNIHNGMPMFANKAGTRFAYFGRQYWYFTDDRSKLASTSSFGGYVRSKLRNKSSPLPSLRRKLFECWQVFDGSKWVDCPGASVVRRSDVAVPIYP